MSACGRHAVPVIPASVVALIGSSPRGLRAGPGDDLSRSPSGQQIAKDIKKANAKRKKVRLNRPRLEMAFAVTEGMPENARSHQRGVRQKII